MGARERTFISPCNLCIEALVSADRSYGRAPDGRDDCEDGKIDVAVVVKDQRTGAAASFSMQVLVNDESTRRPRRRAPPARSWTSAPTTSG
jgi:hypothetical protein